MGEASVPEPAFHVFGSLEKRCFRKQISSVFALGENMKCRFFFRMRAMVVSGTDASPTLNPFEKRSIWESAKNMKCRLIKRCFSRSKSS